MALISAAAKWSRRCSPAGLVLLLAVAVVALLPRTAAARTWHVPGDAETIQAGINLAQAGDDVLVGFIGIPLVVWRTFHEEPSCEFCFDLRPWLRGILFGAATGAITGSVIGAFTPRWRPVYRASAPDTLRIWK